VVVLPNRFVEPQRKTYLLVEAEDVGEATIDGVEEARVYLIAEGGDSVCTLLHGDVVQHVGDVTGTKHFGHSSKVHCSLVLVEVWRKDAIAYASTT
jgi:hypothetical protein